MPDLPHSDVTQLLAQIASGRQSAAEELLPLVYDELRALAGSYFRQQPSHHTLQPTALVHEAYVRLVDGNASVKSRAHFFALSARVMRQVLVNHAEQKAAAKRGEGWERITLDAAAAGSSVCAVDLIALNEALVKLHELDARQSQVVEMRYFGGLTVEEIADVLSVSPRTVEMDWRMARLWLLKELGGADPS